MGGAGISLGTYGVAGAGAASAQTATGSSRVQAHNAQHHAPKPAAPKAAADHTARSHGNARAALKATPLVAATFARTFNVNDSGDTTDATPGDGACADSSAKCTLRAAIEEANADSGASSINIPSGMKITLTSALDGITHSIQINGTGATVDGADNQVFYVTTGSGAPPAVQINGLTITGDNGSSSPVEVNEGGLTLSGVTITGNDISGGSGGGVYVDSNGSLWMANSSVGGNSASDAGGVYVDGAAYISNSAIDSNTATSRAGGLENYGNTTLENTTVNANHVTGANGRAGGVYTDELFQMTGGSIDGNALDNAGYGAGLYNDYIAQLANVTVSNNSISDGTGSNYSEGAGVYDNGDALSLDHVTLNGNKSKMVKGEKIYGTAVYSDDYSLRLVNSSIDGTANDGSAGNSYIEGGAFYLDYDGHASLSNVTITNTTNNSGTNYLYGGALSAENSIDMSGVTISTTSNVADYIGGGAVYCYDESSDSSINGINISNTNNHAVYSSYGEVDGGAIYLDAYVSFSQVSIDKTNNLADLGSASTPSSNETSVYGGAIFDDGYEKTWSTVSITNTTSKAVGGNGYIEGGVVENDEGMNLTDVQIVGAAEQADQGIIGGGIASWDNLQADRVTVANVTANVLGGSAVSDNHWSKDSSNTPYLGGAGLYTDSGITFLNSTIGNVTGSAPSTAKVAGGVYVDGTAAALTNVTMANNSISGAADKTFWLDSSTGSGTGLVNSIVSSSTAATNCGGGGTVTSAGYNIDNGSSCGFTNAGDQQNTDPKVANVADNGGLVQTAALLVGSPAINAGDNSKCPVTDERGVDRPVLGTCDIGAYEYNLDGYRFAASDGGVFSFGPGAHFYGSTGGVKLVSPIVGMASDPATGGYWLVAADGGVFAFHAPFYGSMGGKHLNQPIVGISAAPGGTGYRLVAKDGGIFSFGKGAPFYGSTGNLKLVSPIVGMATDQATGGYWMVAADGGMFAFHAPFYGSMGGKKLAQPVVGMAPAPFGQGYWMVAKDGGIFSFGKSAHFYGSTGNVKLAQPIVAIAADDVTGGYWMVAADGGVFAFHAPFYGSTGNVKLVKPIVAAAAAS